MEEKSAATAYTLDEVKEEVRKSHDEIKQHVDLMENKVKNIEEKFVDFGLRIGAIVQNICSSLFDPQGSQSANWKSY